MALEEMGPEFGCVGSRNEGKGKALAHSLAEGFPTVLQAARGALCQRGLNAHSNVDSGCWRPSLGTKNVPWRPKVDQAAKEQSALLTTACAGPSPIQHCAPSYAHRLENAGASTCVCIDCEDVVVDATLCAEHAFLEVRDVKVAARRLNDLAGRREVSAPASEFTSAGSFWNHLHT